MSPEQFKALCEEREGLDVKRKDLQDFMASPKFHRLTHAATVLMHQESRQLRDLSETHLAQINLAKKEWGYE